MAAGDSFVPSSADVDEILAWFTRYDALAVAKDFEGMADQAMFPVNEVTDGQAESCDRATFIAQMTAEMGGAGDIEMDIAMDSVRTPHFINENLVFVITDATITAGGYSRQVRYGDLLVRCADGWKFQTMVQGGGAENSTD
ncbi:nuclear transport factor 2 family protein [Mycolicibacterium vaccae]|uniref:nuclear transport factor 2 family protein n=1 Tax=Mycolicibacterium vaccae TaxID=1810 RepID=UPI003CF55355